MPKIYTKTGDQGETGLFGGRRVSKDHPRIEAYGTVDELNSFIGLVRDFDPRLETVQNHLFDLGASLAAPADQKTKGASPKGDSPKAEKKAAPVGGTEICFLEGWIDEVEGKLSPLKNFILPGGTVTAVRFHLARSVCRRAERRVISLKEKEGVLPEIIVYLNRLSDLLFVLAREANRREEVADIPWTKRGV
ncbi:MAG: cob(I)yrinic acid a,c-diamide adenosyltransferase [Deltaproteobacteria bacterium]|nr:cob(I)yrinic acid a,c-diamide adenosyltransferase [Deltaproteobacteria bacterium]